jgi:hypothetical protein
MHACMHACVCAETDTSSFLRGHHGVGKGRAEADLTRGGWDSAASTPQTNLCKACSVHIYIYNLCKACSIHSHSIPAKTKTITHGKWGGLGSLSRAHVSMSRYVCGTACPVGSRGLGLRV